jgi:hypothetical protein
MLSNVILNGNQPHNFGMNQNRCQEPFSETDWQIPNWLASFVEETVPETVFLI